MCIVTGLERGRYGLAVSVRHRGFDQVIRHPRVVPFQHIRIGVDVFLLEICSVEPFRQV